MNILGICILRARRRRGVSVVMGDDGASWEDAEDERATVRWGAVMWRPDTVRAAGWMRNCLGGHLGLHRSFIAASPRGRRGHSALPGRGGVKNRRNNLASAAGRDVRCLHTRIADICMVEGGRFVRIPTDGTDFWSRYCTRGPAMPPKMPPPPSLRSTVPVTVPAPFDLSSPRSQE